MSTKPALVLIHGHGVDSSIWNAVYDDLSTDYRVLKPNLSTATSHETMQGYAEELYGQLQRSSLDSCVLVGHSMGGYIALALAELHPELVTGLVLFNSTALADDDAKKQARQKAVALLMEKGSPAFIGENVPKMFGESFRQDQAGAIDQYVQTFSQLPAEALAAGLKAMAARADRTEVLQKATFPVLIVAGEQDQIIPLEKNRQLADQIPNAKLVMLEKTGHLGMVENPPEAIRILREFLAGH